MVYRKRINPFHGLFDMEELLSDVCQISEVFTSYVSLLQLDDAFKKLNEREQCVLKNRYSGKTLRETGDHVVKVCNYKSPCEGISRERARQIQETALRRLSRFIRQTIFLNELKHGL